MISITLLLISVNDNSIVLSCSAKNPWVLCSSDNQQRIHLQILLIELQNISNADNICRPLHKLAQGVTISHLAHAMFSKWYPCSLLAPYSSMGTLVKTQFWSCQFFAQNLWLRVKVLARLPSLCRDLAAVFSLDLTLNLCLSPIPGTLVPCSPGQASALGPLHWLVFLPGMLLPWIAIWFTFLLFCFGKNRDISTTYCYVSVCVPSATDTVTEKLYSSYPCGALA